jgi:hypothetical protein
VSEVCLACNLKGVTCEWDVEVVDLGYTAFSEALGFGVRVEGCIYCNLVIMYILLVWNLGVREACYFNDSVLERICSTVLRRST